MMEFFIQAHSFAAPFCSDESTTFVEAATAREALEKFAKEYRHPAGLYAANAYADANALHKGRKPLAIWRSFVAQEVERLDYINPETSTAIRKKHGTRGSVVEE